jgi:hypothetical protein
MSEHNYNAAVILVIAMFIALGAIAYPCDRWTKRNPRFPRGHEHESFWQGCKRVQE